MTKEAIVKAPSERKKRTPIGTRNVLTVQGKEPGYTYRIVNDEGDRVIQFQEAGYELVKASDVKVGDRRVEQTSSEGSIAKVSVDKRLGTKGVVMRIKDEWYKEDQAAKQKKIDEMEQTMKNNALSGSDYGKLDIGRTSTQISVS